MNILGRRIKPVHLKFTLPLLAIWLAALIWAVHHHTSNERYRLGYLAEGVRGVAERNAAIIDPVAVGRISCETLADQDGAEGACPDGATIGAESCELSSPCGFRYGVEGHRLRADLQEALNDLRHLPYFSEMYRTRVLGRAGEGRQFEFRVEVQRRISNGGFTLVDALYVPQGEGSGVLGAPVAQVALRPGALAQATVAWERGQPTEWITRETYQVFLPIIGARGTGKGVHGTESLGTESLGTESLGTVALLALQVERERHSALYVVGLVLMLSFWFIGVGVVTVATTAFVGMIWLFNFLTIWGVGLMLAVLVLLIWYRKRAAYGPTRGRNGHKPA